MSAEIAQLELDLEERHKKELEEHKQRDKSRQGDDGAIDEHMERLHLTSQATEQKEEEREGEREEGSAPKAGAGGTGKKSRDQKRKVTF